MSSEARVVLVTGAAGFIGRNLVAALERDPRVSVRRYGRDGGDLDAICADVDAVVHLAGENRPADPAAFVEVNVGFTRRLLDALAATGRRVPVLFSSSVQATTDSAYGASKRQAEREIDAYAAATGSVVEIVRLPNVFGKWSRPDYNSVVATFCHNAIRGIPLRVDDPQRGLVLVHVDDVVRAFVEWSIRVTDEGRSPSPVLIAPHHEVQLGQLAELVQAYAQSRFTRVLPDLSTPFARALYGTLTSFYDIEQLAVPATVHSDERGWLFEVVKSPHAGQVFMSSTRPGFVRGDHWHDTKVEKFTVVQGRGSILFRAVFSDDIVVYDVSGDDVRSVDIPTGYVHAIRNDGDTDLLVLFWASEILDPSRPDTYYEKVLDEER